MAEDLEKAFCCICGDKGSEPVWDKNPFKYVRCSECGLIYVSPRLTDKALQKEYEGNMAKSVSKNILYSFRDMASLKNLDGRLRRGEELMYLVERYKQGGKILDIGCNRGFILSNAASWGWETYGIEVVPWMTKLIEKEFGTKIYNGKLREVSHEFPDNFLDAITMIDIIEHFQDPLKDLLEIHRILKDDGIIILNTVDVESAHAQILGDKWGHANPREHIYLFSRKTLRKILEKAGFQILSFNPSKGTVGEMEVHIRKSGFSIR